MKIAKSLKFNRIITVEECDYDSYLKLDLICEFCKNPVFYCRQKNRQAHSRKLKSGKLVEVRESKEIGEYFAHFPNRSDTENDLCEMRSNIYSRDEINNRIIQANNKDRGQRLKAFQRQFWSYLCQASKMRNIEDDLFFVESGFLSRPYFEQKRKPLPNQEKLFEDLEKKFMNAFIDDIAARVYQLKAEIKEELARGLRAFYLNDVLDLNKKLQNSRGKFNLEHEESLHSLNEVKSNRILWGIHETVCKEALEFLLAKSSYPILCKTIQKALFDLIISVEKPDEVSKLQILTLEHRKLLDDAVIAYDLVRRIGVSFKKLSSWDNNQKNELCSWAVCNIVLIIISTPWIEIFYPNTLDTLKKIAVTSSDKVRNGLTRFNLYKSKHKETYYFPFSLADSEQIDAAENISKAIDRFESKGGKGKFFTSISIQLINTIADYDISIELSPGNAIAKVYRQDKDYTGKPYEAEYGEGTEKLIGASLICWMNNEYLLNAFEKFNNLSLGINSIKATENLPLPWEALMINKDMVTEEEVETIQTCFFVIALSVINRNVKVKNNEPGDL